VNDKPHVGFVRTNIVRLKGGIDTSHWARQEASELSAGEAFVSSVAICFCQSKSYPFDN